MELSKNAHVYSDLGYCEHCYGKATSLGEGKLRIQTSCTPLKNHPVSHPAQSRGFE